jgi:hypothetical protein
MKLHKLLQPVFTKSSRTPIRFELRYAPKGAVALPVGSLTYRAGLWTFAYDEAFKAQREAFHPIEGFNDVDKVYESTILFPFFAVRIPDIRRSDIRQAIERAHMTDPDLPDLLALFGRRTISSPAFELIPVQV